MFTKYILAVFQISLWPREGRKNRRNTEKERGRDYESKKGREEGQKKKKMMKTAWFQYQIKQQPNSSGSFQNMSVCHTEIPQREVSHRGTKTQLPSNKIIKAFLSLSIGKKKNLNQLPLGKYIKLICFNTNTAGKAKIKLWPENKRAPQWEKKGDKEKTKAVYH